MRPSSWYLPIATTTLCLSSYSACEPTMGASQSVLDPYANIQAPNTRLFKSSGQDSTPVENANSPATNPPTYVSMPQEQGKPKTTKSKNIVVASVGKVKSTCTKTFQAAHSGVVNGTKASRRCAAKSSSSAKKHLVSGTKKIKSGIATGAKTSGACFTKSVHVIGQGFKSSGSKLKKGSEAVGSKIANLPHAFSHKSPNSNMSAQVPFKHLPTQPAVSAPAKLVSAPVGLTPSGASPNGARSWMHPLNKFFKHGSQANPQTTASSDTNIDVLH